MRMGRLGCEGVEWQRVVSSTYHRALEVWSVEEVPCCVRPAKIGAEKREGAVGLRPVACELLYTKAVDD